MSNEGSVSAVSNPTYTSIEAPSTSTPENEKQKSLVKRIIDLAIKCQNATDAQMKAYLTDSQKTGKALTALLSLEAEFSKPDKNGKSRDANTPLSKKEKELIEELKQLGIELPPAPTIYDIRSEKEAGNLKIKHSYQKADDLGRNKMYYIEIAKEILKSDSASKSRIISNSIIRG